LNTEKHIKDELNSDMNLSEEIKIAITCFGDEVAPCFSATRLFRIWKIGPRNKITFSELNVDETGGLARIRLLKNSGINVLICNGIEGQERQLLQASGCHVVENATGSANDSLYEYLAGKMQIKSSYNNNGDIQLQPHNSDLVDWTVNLFTNHGWSLDRANESDSYPIDLNAIIQCPVCGKNVRVAICCGAHSYRVESEIQEFSHVTSREYNARVFVHNSTSNMIKKCQDYEVELLDPTSTDPNAVHPTKKEQLPPLKGRIKNHDKINIDQVEN
jgi:predicted Fe-Mo cluster-binding NifX family protein